MPTLHTRSNTLKISYMDEIRKICFCQICLNEADHIFTFIRLDYDNKNKTQMIKYQDKCTECGHQFIDSISSEGWMALCQNQNPN